MMTIESMLSKRPVLRFTAALFFLHDAFCSHIFDLCVLDVWIIAMEKVRNYGKIVAY